MFANGSEGELIKANTIKWWRRSFATPFTAISRPPTLLSRSALGASEALVTSLPPMPPCCPF